MEAQVLELVQFMCRNAQIKNIVLLQGYKNEAEKQRITKKVAPYKLKIYWFKTYPNYTIFTPLALSALNNVLKELIQEESFMIHVRGVVYGAFTKKILQLHHKPLRVLVDVRGADKEEILQYKRGNKCLRYFKVLYYERQLRRVRDHGHLYVTAVSSALRDYLIQNYQYNPNKVSVHPNICSDRFQYNLEARSNIRKQYHIAENELLAVCSSGGGASWQHDKDIVAALCSKGIKVLNLSPNRIESEGVYNILVPFAEMPQYLSASDIAVLWRKHDIVNKVASPCKFGEFAAMGLYVIHNGSIDIATDYIRQTQAGCIITTSKDLQDIECDGQKRTQWVALGQEKFGITSIAQSYLATYDMVSSSPP